MKNTSEKGKLKQLVALIKATQPPKFSFGISLFLSLLTTLALSNHWATHHCFFKRKAVEKACRIASILFDANETGDSVSRMTNDTGIIKNLITEHLTGFITGMGRTTLGSSTRIKLSF